MSDYEERARPKPSGATASSSDVMPKRLGFRHHAKPGDARADARPKPTRALEQYLAANARPLWRDVAAYLAHTSFPMPSPKLGWLDEDRFLAHVIDYLAPIDLFIGRDPLEELLYPAKPYDEIAGVVPAGISWSPAVATALAPLFEQAIGKSLLRLGPRWVEQAENRPEPEGVADERKSLVAESSLVPSHPMDLAVRRGLTAGAVVDLKAGLKPAARRKQLAPPRKVEVHWQGERDPALWNFVKPEPADATPEEVARALWSSRFWDADGSIFAHRLSRTGGLYGVPAGMARAFAAAREHAPEPGAPIVPRAVAVAGSKQATALSTTETASRGGSAPDLAAKLDDSITRLEYLRDQLVDWKLDGTIVVGLAWTRQQRAALASGSAHATDAALLAQHRLLTEIVERVQPMLGAKDASARAATRKVVVMYARAAAASHLDATCKALIADAVAEQSQIVLSALRASQTELVALSTVPGTAGDDARSATDLVEQSRTMQTRLLRGAPVDGGELELLLLGSQETALHLRILQIRAQLKSLSDACNELNGMAHELVAAFHTTFRNLALAAPSLEGHLAAVETTWNTDAFDSTKDVSDDSNRTRIDVRRAALARAQKRFDEIQHDPKLVDALTNGHAILKDQAKYTRIVQVCAMVAAMIGLSLLGSFAAGAIGRLASGWLARAGAVEAVGVLGSTARFIGRHAALGGEIVGGAADVALNTAGQVALQGGRVDQSLLENTLQTLLSTKLLRHFGEDLELAKQVQQETKALWGRGSRLAAATLDYSVTVSAHVIMNIATAYVANQIATGVLRISPQPGAHGVDAAIEETFMHGASVALGRLAHQHLAENRAFHDKLAKLAAADAVRRTHADLARLARVAEHSPSTEHALDTLRLLRRAQQEELAVMQQLERDAGAREHAGISVGELRAHERVAANARSEVSRAGLEVLALHASHLEEVITGELWKGSPKQIHQALELAKHTYDVKASRDATSKRWTVEIGERRFAIEERADTAGSSDRSSKAATSAARPQELGQLVGGEHIVTAQHVPGSSFRGNGGHEWSGADLVHARTTLEHVLRGRSEVDDVAAADPTNIQKPDEKARAQFTFVVTLKARPGEAPRRITVRVDYGPLRGDAAATASVNPTQQGFTNVVGHGDSVHVVGRHVIQLSERLDPAHVERALAHEVAEMFALDDLNRQQRYAGPDALAVGAEAHVLSPHDHGRLAELEVVARTDSAESTRELQALIDHLGLREGVPGADRRFALAKRQLSPHSVEKLRALRGEPTNGSPQHAVVASIRERAAADREAAVRRRQLASEAGPRMPTVIPVEGVDLHETLDVRADIAERARAAKSDETWSKLTALVTKHRTSGAHGHPVLPYELMIGGGASLAARDPSHLLVDDRGRWQADGNHELAQTAHQIREVKHAKLGDPTILVQPNERVPLDAVRAWEDDIAAQGPVVNGRARVLRGDHGEMLVEITHGTDKLTFAVTSTPHVSTGFPPERIPGQPFNARFGGLAWDLKAAIERITHAKPELQESANRVLEKLRQASIRTYDDPTHLQEVLTPDIEQALRADPAANVVLQHALQFGPAAEHWLALKAQFPDHVFLGDEANLGTEHALRSNNWIIGGLGGTGVSAAEIILKNNPAAHVTMIGMDSPAGLLGNDQFSALAKAYGDRALTDSMQLPPSREQRLHLKAGRVDAPQVVPSDRAGPLHPEANVANRAPGMIDPTASCGPVSGTAYIAALGRVEDYPPVVVQYMEDIRRIGGEYYISPLFEDGQYVGYRVRFAVKGKETFLDVTGAASRFLPLADARKHRDPGVNPSDFDRVARSADLAAPAESGNFAGGYAATTTQSSLYAQKRRSEPPPVFTASPNQAIQHLEPAHDDR
ncbi:MAG TPA: hypothetical protein VFQ53_13430 [Kofleriaceae bacterium]|nr:hypothetical protein [Kofleriaceae bacterium]